MRLSLTRLRRVLLLALLIWIAACFVAFMCGPAVEVLGSPRWLPLPWSDFRDFVAAPDGRVYVSVGFYNRVLVYDGAGSFVGSYPVQETKSGPQLAADKEGNVYYWAAGRVYVVGGVWDVREVAREVGCNSWRLEDVRKAVCVSREGGRRRTLEGAAVPGEIIFSSGGTQQRESFACADGSSLRRTGNSLVKLSPDGKVLATFGTPWYFSWAVFPFPAALAWPAMFLLGAYFDWRDRRQARR